MVQNTLLQVKRRIEESESIQKEKKKELLDLLVRLQSEIETLELTDREQAESIASFTHLSTQEATRTNRSEPLSKLSVEGLSKTAEGFEVSHPRLVEIVNSICAALSNLGI